MLAIATANELKVDGTTTRNSAKDIGEKLKEVMKKVTKYDKLQKNYKPEAVTIERRDGTKLVKEMKKDLEKILQNKIHSILKLADKAELLHSNYTYNEELQFVFLDSKDLENTGNITLTEEISFSTKIKVNFQNSTVHIPTDVYKGSATINNTAKWSKGLDEAFTENRKAEPSLLWQYFGSHTGVYRVYPGYKWRQPNDKDFFDHRRRGWYIQGSSSPKDMVILLDLSGSMIGNKLAISKLSAMFLLETLQENDFVNIVIFNKEASMLCENKEVMDKFKKKYPNFKGNCTRSLLQATKQNRKYLSEMVNYVQATEVANVSEGFKLAVAVLKNATKTGNQSSSGCIRTINFFTDGVEDTEYKKTLDVLKKAEAKEAQIRIFGYIVGREKGSAKQPVIDIACKYRGYFYTVETLSDVRENVTSYLNVLSRPLALQRYMFNDTPTWTPLYLDQLGLGLMITVVAPVYDRKKKQSLLGVVGTDVALPQLKNSVPEAKVGVDGYGFAINNNGFIVIHPFLKDDKSSATNLLLQDVNLEDSKENLENLSRNLIDRKTGSTSFKMRALSKDKKRVSAQHTYYFSYTEINGTSFSSAIAMTELGRNYFKLKKDPYISAKLIGMLKARDNETVMISPWDVCPNIVPKKRATTPLYLPVHADVNDIIENITGQDSTNAYKLCDEVLLNQLLYGAEMTNDLGWDIEVNDTNGYLSVFVGTNGGFSRVRAPGGESPIGNDVTNEPFYQQAADFNKSDIIVTAKANTDDDIITASTPIYVEDVKDNSKKVLAAVIGMQMKGSTLQEILLNSSQVCKDDSDKWGCYLIDEDGYIVASNANQTLGEVGKRFGEVHGEVFNAMIEKEMFDVIEYKDANSKCGDGGGSSSNAMRLMNPLLAVSSYVMWMTQTLFWSIVQFNIYSFFSGKSQVIANTDSTYTNYCTAVHNLYKATEKTFSNPDGKCSENSCVGKFYVAKIEKSNLRLVILQNDCCAGKQKKFNKFYAEAPHFALASKHYRKLPNLKCYAFDKKESDECGSGCNLTPTKLLIVLLTLLYPFLAH